MAWYSDEEYELRQDCKEKKSIAASAFKQRTHCGKGGRVRFPSDNLSKKELKAMNGECVTYRLGEPMNWDTFKSMPDDKKCMYINIIRDKFGATDAYIADMMGVNKVTLGKYIRCLNLGKGSAAKGSKKKWDKEKFLAWAHGADPDAVEESVDEETPVEEPCENTTVTVLEAVEAGIPGEAKEDHAWSNSADTCRRRAVPGTGKMTFDGHIEEIVETLRMLLAGAEVTLDVAWTVIEPEEFASEQEEAR